MNDLPLERKWTFYYDTPRMHKNYSDIKSDTKWLSEIEEFYTADSIGNFWRLYNNIIPPSKISYKSTYYMYENNTKPFDCDINHLNGGSLIFTIPYDFQQESKEIENVWLKFLLTLIGENTDYSEYITGVSLQKNRRDYAIKLSLRIKSEELNDYYIKHFTEINKKEFDAKFQSHEFH